LDRRAGPRVYLRVAGPTNPKLAVEELAAHRAGASGTSTTGSFTLRNAGNVVLGASQLTVRDGHCAVLARLRPNSIDELLPTNALHLLFKLSACHMRSWRTRK
jgi:hypothetical protein